LALELLQRGFYAETCFFAQQAAEFLLKARLIELTGSRPYTHSVLHLLELLARLLGREMGGDVVRCAKYLTEQYVASRYPDARLLDHDRADAEECIRCLELIHGVVQGGVIEGS